MFRLRRLKTAFHFTSPVLRRAIAYGYSRRLDRGPQARAERPSLHDRPLIVERRSPRSALRAPVETTEIAICDSPTVLRGRGPAGPEGEGPRSSYLQISDLKF